MQNNSKRITAVLGPTNTGKTHLAVETMMEFKSGIFGLPLRLLAREIFDKCVSKVGAEKVALITGEEKIIPRSPKYYICTVESMPQNIIYREKNPVVKNFTRECLDPWDRVLLRPGGSIHPCFVAEESVGFLSRERPLNEILNGPWIKRYRQGILTGDLVPACRDCHCKAWVSIHEMEKRVTEYLLEYDEPARSNVAETAKTFLKL